jgi:amidase
VAVKDCIDVAGVVTTVGCAVIAARGLVAAADARVVATAREYGARVVGKTSLTELCWSADGINTWSGTPVNPLDASRMPGGSSSGSAVAVATGEADVGYGTDTGGSVRVPAACCCIVGLKTTWGRIPPDGVYPLAPSLDTVGPLGRDVAAVELGMRLLEPGFSAADYAGPMTVGRLRTSVEVQPQIDAAVDAALATAGFAAEDITGVDFATPLEATGVMIDREGYLANEYLLPQVSQLDPRNQRNMAEGALYTEADLAQARGHQEDLRETLASGLRRFPVLALPTMATPPPRLDERVGLTQLTAPINLTGLPALALPLTVRGNLPASLQLVGPRGGEELLIAIGRIVEAALSAG